MPVRTFIQKFVFWSIIILFQTSSVRAEVILDNFQSPNPAASVSFSSAGGSNGNGTGTYAVGVSSLASGSGLLSGATRTTSADVSALSGHGSGVYVGNDALSPGNGLELTTSTGTNASATVTYSNFGSLNLASDTDLNFLFPNGVTPGGSATSMPVSVTLNGVTYESSILGASGSTNLIVGLNSTNFSGVNFSNITSLSVTFNDGNAGANFNLSNIGADPAVVTAVPEPASLFIWGTASLLGVWYSRRKLQRKLAV